MSVERMVAPDQTTCAYYAGRPFAPPGDAGPKATEVWSALNHNIHATFDAEQFIEARDIAPTLTWGTSPEQADRVRP